MKKLLANVFSVVAVLLCTTGQASSATGLHVGPSTAKPGETVEVTGTGFFCSDDDVGPKIDHPVAVRWDDGESDTDPSSPLVGVRGEVRFTLKIPPDATPRTHEITAAACAVDAKAFVTVLAERAPVLSAVPDTGHAGSSTKLHGTDFGCDPVKIQWDDNPPTDTPTNKGNFDNVVQVPDDATAGMHTISVSCADPTGKPTRAGFTVVQPRTSTTAPPRPTPPLPPLPTPPPNPLPPSPAAQTTTTPSPTTTTTHADPSFSAISPPAPSTTYRPLLPQSIASPSELSHDPISYLVLFALGILFALLMFLPLVAFPAEIFNKALEERTERQDRLKLPSWLQVALFTVATGSLLTLVEPEAAFDRKTVALGIGLMVAVCLTTLSYCLLGERFSFWLSRRRSILRTLPYALLIAVMCAIVSRVVDFQPGYVYGLIAGYAPLVRTLGHDAEENRRNEARSILLGVFLTLILSLVAWLLWDRIDTAAESPNAGFDLLVMDSTLSAIVLMGVETVLFGLIPFRFLDGLKLVTTNPRSWIVIYALTTTAYLCLLLQEAKPTTPAAVLRAMALFLAFGACSFAFWLYVLHRKSGVAPPRGNESAVSGKQGAESGGEMARQLRRPTRLDNAAKQNRSTGS